ncbi:MAG: hypothetical protein IJU51_03700 [Clostridia bacterium]|nr:hypothetical protein [Clostridia bacterium]
MKKKCFVNPHCIYDCPNFATDRINDKYGYGIADDMGLEEVKCKYCHYETGECEDCLFYGSKDCPEKGV